MSYCDTFSAIPWLFLFFSKQKIKNATWHWCEPACQWILDFQLADNLEKGIHKFLLLAKGRNLQLQMWLWDDSHWQRETVQELKAICSGFDLMIKWYITDILWHQHVHLANMTADLSHGNMPATVLLEIWITSWLWILVQWHRTDRKRCIWAHHA